jgi:molybdopterin converting factor subunit 1
MKTVHVRYFAAFREATGTESEQVSTRAGTAAELFRECADRHKSLERFSASLVAVNEDLADWESTIDDGDEILFFPPVAGG